MPQPGSHAPRSASRASSSQATPSRSLGRSLLVNTGALTFASGWRIVVSFVVQLLIARWLGLTALGQYAVILAYLHVCQVVSDFGLPQLLMRDIAQNPQLRNVRFRQAVGLQFLLAIGAWAGISLAATMLALPAPLPQAMWLGGALLPLYAITSACEALLAADERMERVMIAETIGNTGGLILAALAMRAGGGLLALVGVLVAGQAIALLGAFAFVLRAQPPAMQLRRSDLTIREQLKRASPFFGAAVADVLLQRLDIVLVGLVGGAAAAGVYAAVYNLVRVITKIIQSFWQALYPTLSRLQKEQPTRLQEISRLAARVALMATGPLVVVATLSGTDLLRLLYGAAMGNVAQILAVSIWIAPLFVIESHAITLMMALRQANKSLLISAVHLLCVLILLPVLTLQSGALGAAVAVVCATLVASVLGWLILRRINLQLPLNQSMRITAAVIASGAAYWTMPWSTGAKLAAALLAYAIMLWSLGALPVRELSRLKP